MEFRQHKRDYYIHKLGYSQVNEETLREQAEGYVRYIRDPYLQVHPSPFPTHPPETPKGPCIYWDLHLLLMSFSSCILCALIWN